MFYNIYQKKIISKNTKTKARKKNYLKFLNIFVVIRYNYYRMILYIVPNRVGKITTDIYTEHILLIIFPDLQKKNLTLIQDVRRVESSQILSY
jgi:hypothetical protein